MNTAVSSKRTTIIRTINDRCRRHFLGCAVMLTPTVQELPTDKRAQLLHAVRGFNAFSADNDPYHEHDFGAVELHGEKWFWKFDYYEPSMRFGSNDPSDPDETRRVLTIMHASEY